MSMMGVNILKLFPKHPASSIIFERLHMRGYLNLSSFERTICSSHFSTFVVKDLTLHSCFRFQTNIRSPPDSAVVSCRNLNRNTKLEHSVCRFSSSANKQASDPQKNEKSLTKARENPYAHLTVGQKVKEAGKDVSYFAVIVVGIAVTGMMFYMIGSELLSSQSPSGVYGDALKKCQNHMEVAAALGEPIKGYGETNRRGRRRHVSHTEFDVAGVPHMRMRFYIEGPYKKATVHVEVQKADTGKYEYRYLVVETEGYPHRTFILEDNR